MLKLILIRHGESPKKDRKFFCINFGRPLTSNGRKQAYLLGKKLKEFEIDEFISSDMKRALQTSKVISKIVGKNFSIDKLLREVNPEIETNEDLISRCLLFLKKIQNKEGVILISSHGTFNRTFLTVATKTRKNGSEFFNSLNQDNACVNLMSFDKNKWDIKKINDIGHLKNG